MHLRQTLVHLCSCLALGEDLCSSKTCLRRSCVCTCRQRYTDWRLHMSCKMHCKAIQIASTHQTLCKWMHKIVNANGLQAHAMPCREEISSARSDCTMNEHVLCQVSMSGKTLCVPQLAVFTPSWCSGSYSLPGGMTGNPRKPCACRDAQ